jgi:hypothetical protein
MKITSKLITLNEYINLERSNKYTAAKVKKSITNNIALECRDYPKIEGLNNVLINWFIPNRRIDHDNISFCKKFIFDGLKKAGVIKDDSPKYINNFKENFILDRNIKEIECEVFFLKVAE